MHHCSVKAACFSWIKHSDKIATEITPDNQDIAIMIKRNTRIRPAEDAKSYIQSSRDKPGFIERFIDSNKGRGVFASQPIEPGAFVLEYRGELLSVEECQSRQYTERESTFLFEFEWQNHLWCIDASKEDGSLGRLVNDNEKSPNCIMKKIIVDEKPHLCLFAVKKIEIGDEIDYNYGDSKWPWRKKGKSKQTPALAVETKMSPVDHPSNEDSNRVDPSTQVTNKQTPALAVETEMSPVDHPSNEDSNRVDPSTQVTNKQTPALAVETEMSPVDHPSNEDSNRVDPSTQVTNKQTPALAVETEVSPVDHPSNEDSNRVDPSTQVTNKQTPALAVETEMSPVDHPSNEDSNRVDPSTQVTNKQTPALAVETEMSPVDHPSNEDSNRVDPSTQVTNKQTPALAVETEMSPVDHPSNEDSNRVDPSTQVTNKQTPALAVETEMSPVDHPSNEDSNRVDPSTQVTNKQTPALAVETEMSPVDHPSNEDSNRVDPSTQGFTVRGFSLVDYSESDDTDEGCINDEGHTPHWDEVVQKNRMKETILKDSVPDLLHNSNESVVGETDDEDNDVPKLRRTKSILMDRVPDFSDALYDSSDDSTEGHSPESKKASKRLRRSSCHPIQDSLLGSDETGGDSEEEYIPNPKEESADSDGSLELSLKKQRKKKTASTSQSRSKSSSQSQSESSQTRNFKTNHNSTQRFPEGRADTNEDEMAPLEEEPTVYVNPVLKKDNGSRKYNKKHQCLYCGRLVQKMSRHLMRKHKNKIDVAKAFSLPKNSKERRLQLDYIRNKGNFEHNTEVLESHKGKLIPWKQPKKKTEGQVFAHCVYCYGLFTKKVMWRHFKVCKFKPQGKPSKPGKTRVLALCAFAEPAPPGFSEAYWNFLSDMNQDKIAVAIKEDYCILEYGYRLFMKNKKVISQHQYIRQKLRELGRLLLEAKKIAPVKTMKDLIKPEKYSHVVTAARCLAGFSDETGRYQRPSLARKVGHSLHSLAMFFKSEGLKMKDKQTVQDAEEFAQLYQESWKFDIASQALTQLDQTKWNSPQLLPFTQDVQNLHCYLSEKQLQQLNALKEESSPSNWKDLAKVTLAQVILFNRRRAGEVSRMPLSVYLSRDTSETHEDVNLALTALEQKLCKHFVRITIVGKRGRKVPVLLTPHMRESIDTLIEKREECGVLNENGYLFALPQSVHYLRGSDCIRQFVNDCDGIKIPKALTSTKLRKHIATLSTVLNLKTTELDQLADFLGHNIEVHRKHYRLPEGTLQLAKISKVLLAMEQGRLGEYKGKSLDEIHLDVNETVNMEECSPQDIEGFSQEDIEDDCIPEVQGTEQVDSVTSLQEDISMAQVSNDEVSVTSLQECTSTSSCQNQRKLAKKRGKQTAVKRSWTPEECAAVERHLRKFIVMNQVPGKVDCEHCITAEPQALGNRDWKAVKYFIKNRITAMRRKVQ